MKILSKIYGWIKAAASWVIEKLNKIPNDKVKHFAVGFLLAAISILIPMSLGLVAWGSLVISVLVVIGCEWFKEKILDKKPSMGDVVATVIGAFILWSTVLIVLTSIYS